MHAQTLHAIPAACQNFVGVALVAHIPDQPVFRCVEHGMQGNGQFNGTEIGGKMPSGFGDGVDQKRADLRAQLLQLSEIQPFDVGRGMDRV